MKYENGVENEEIETLIVQWLENKITTEEICGKLRIGLDKFRLLLNSYLHVIEDYSFKKGDEFVNSMLESIAKETYDEGTLKKCREIIRLYKNGKMLLIDALSESSKLGIKKEHVLAMISTETKKSSNDLFEIMEYEQNLCSDLLTRDQIFNELQKLKDCRRITLWDTPIQPKPRGDMFIRISPPGVVSSLQGLLGDDIRIKDTLEDNMKIVIVPSEESRESLPRIFYLEESENGVIFYSFLSEDRKEKALKRVIEPLIQTGHLTSFWINPEDFFEFGKRISTFDSFLRLKSVSQKFDSALANDFSCDVSGNDIEFIYGILKENHVLPGLISLYSKSSPGVLFEFTNQGTFSLGRGDFITMASKMKEFLSVKNEDRKRFRGSTISYKFSRNIADLDFAFIKDIMKRAFIHDSIKKEDILFPDVVSPTPIRTHFNGVILYENEEQMKGYLFENTYGYNCKFALDKTGLILFSTVYTNALLFEKFYEKIVEHLDENVRVTADPVVKEYESLAQNPLLSLLNYPEIPREKLITILTDIGTQFASLCYEENRHELQKRKLEGNLVYFANKIKYFIPEKEISFPTRAGIVDLLKQQGLFSQKRRDMMTLDIVPGQMIQIKDYFDNLSALDKNISVYHERTMMLHEEQKKLDEF
ncbi:MAG: hypothetical protein HXS54_18625 [Theionarchaea archaeon]|nr:hypothetical protein [Theionarchaea archaeon]